jgi:hypothetical protein
LALRVGLGAGWEMQVCFRNSLPDGLFTLADFIFQSVFLELLVQTVDVRSAVITGWGLGVFFFFFFDDVVFAAFGGGPGGGSQGTIGDGLRVDDYVGRPGLQGKELEVGGGGAKDAEEERGGAVLDLLGDDQAHEFGQGELDGVGVFEGGELDGALVAGFQGYTAAHEAALLVKVTMRFVALGGRSALDAVDLDVLAAADGYGVRWHGDLLKSGVR